MSNDGTETDGHRSAPMLLTGWVILLLFGTIRIIEMGFTNRAISGTTSLILILAVAWMVLVGVGDGLDSAQ